MQDLSEITMKAYKNWLSGWPGSGHPLDRQRFYQFLKTAIENSDKDNVVAYMRENLQKDSKGLSDDQIDVFVNDADVILEFQDL